MGESHRMHCPFDGICRIADEGRRGNSPAYLGIQEDKKYRCQALENYQIEFGEKNIECLAEIWLNDKQ